MNTRLVRIIILGIKRFLRKLLLGGDSPVAIAGGFAVGLFIAFTPTFGIQMILVIIINSILGLNRVAGLVGVYATNIFTAVPIYFFAFWLGQKFLPYEYNIEYWKHQIKITLGNVSLFSAESMQNALEILKRIGLPLWIGGVVLGLFFSLIGYVVLIFLLNSYQRYIFDKRYKRDQRLNLGKE